MRRITTLHFCGIDWTEDRREIPASFKATIELDGVKRDLDLCEEHEKLPIRVLAAVLSDYGTLPGEMWAPGTPKAKKAPKAATVALAAEGQVLCPQPDCGRPFKNEHALRMHLTRGHLLEPGAPITPPDPVPVPGGLLCGIDGCPTVGKNPQGLGRHRMIVHKIPGSSTAAIQRRARKARESSIPSHPQEAHA